MATMLLRLTLSEEAQMLYYIFLSVSAVLISLFSARIDGWECTVSFMPQCRTWSACEHSRYCMTVFASVHSVTNFSCCIIRWCLDEHDSHGLRAHIIWYKYSSDHEKLCLFTCVVTSNNL